MTDKHVYVDTFLHVYPHITFSYFTYFIYLL